MVDSSINRASSQRSGLMNMMVKAADAAARSLRRDFGEVENLQVSRKGPGDFVSRADRRAEELIRDVLMHARPKYGFLGEEGGNSIEGDGEHRWIVDPLDGTTNFLHGLPHFSISIGLERSGELIAGLVYDPLRDELFHAEKGGGAFLNNKRLRVSARKTLADSLTAMGTPFVGHGDERIDAFTERVRRIISQTPGVRRFGSAALDFAYTAAGRYDGFWEANLSPWDVAAGILLVREAGGMVTDYEGNTATLDSPSFLAANSDLHPQLAKVLK